ncbi:hypothetical protein [Sinomicrobium oceani]|uniref:hypothetical protein n=1 Tax=Sinomicrobium oceani TaxID=1150368 RepID=UPI00227C1528|nr:hypothetical protein [Sinomicrobium oceani]
MAIIPEIRDEIQQVITGTFPFFLWEQQMAGSKTVKDLCPLYTTPSFGYASLNK